MSSRTEVEEYDVIVVGAGIGGLYAVHKLRKLGLSIRALEQAPGVGGTWYWNKYPGARCDAESWDYSYSFSDQLQQDWVWTQRFPPQPEILSYLNHVADRFDLRRDIDLNTRVVSAAFDEQMSRWMIVTSTGRTISARFCVMTTGTLSAPKDPPFEGLADFTGEWYMTSRWPEVSPDLSGKRVAVIGTGSSGVQTIPELASQAAHLTVFQRTANFSVPANNRALNEEEVRAFKAGYADYRKTARSHPFAMPRASMPDRPHTADTPEQRRALWESKWPSGLDVDLVCSYDDILTSREANDEISEFVRGKIRSKINDPEVANVLVPTDHPFATKRLVVDSNYFETFNRENVSIVDARSTPITRITSNGIATTGQEYAFDVIVFALGFDAITGALLSINPTGRKGLTLKDSWADGPQSYLGIMVAGFPNLFTINGPGSIGVLANMVVSNEQHVDWVAQLLEHMVASDLSTVEPHYGAQREWTDHIQELAHQTLYFEANSWYVGANIPGKPRVFLAYLGGMPSYDTKTREVAENGYEGFEFGTRDDSSLTADHES